MNERDIFTQALQLPPEQRANFVRKACADDAGLLRRVTSLLSENDKLGSFLEDPAPGVTTPLGNGSAPGPRKRLGDFEIVREIGRGGMGIVYEARQLSLNRKVALKVIAGGLALSSSAIVRFRREAEAAAKLHHTNIVPVYMTGEMDGAHYYAMEFVEGATLDQIIRHLVEQQNTATGKGERPDSGSPHGDEAGCDVTEALGSRVAENNQTVSVSNSSLSTAGGAFFDTAARMIADVADAIEYAHEQGVIHRDIKPSNLIHGSDGRLRVMDFGLAKLLDEPGVTISGDFLGTPRYMSPEQIAAGRVGIDHRTDVYSLGATLYELLTLSPPHPGNRRDEVIAKILSKDPPRLRRINKKTPLDLETICLKALEKDPDKRYQSAGKMADDLRRYVNRYTIQARRVGLGARFVKLVRRNKAATAVTVAILFLTMLATASAYWYRRARHDLVVEQQARSDQETAFEGERWARSSIPKVKELMDGWKRYEAFILAERIRAIHSR